MEAAQSGLEAAMREHATLAKALSGARAAAAPLLAGAVAERLADLAMEQASFDVVLAACDPGRLASSRRNS